MCPYQATSKKKRGEHNNRYCLRLIANYSYLSAGIINELCFCRSQSIYWISFIASNINGTGATGVSLFPRRRPPDIDVIE